MKEILFIIGFILSFIYSLAQNKFEMLQSFDKLQLSEKTFEDADSAYRLIANAPIFLHTCKERANNCENRAEFTFNVLSKLGFKPANFWIFKEGLVETTFTTSRSVQKSKGLEFNTHTSQCRTLFWAYHVATGIIITVNGTPDTLIYDPWTQGRFVTLRQWALSFFSETSGRTVYAFPVTGLYSFFGTTAIGQVSTDKNEWLKHVDNDFNQMYCGLCGITPNSKCNKDRFKKEIGKKREEILKYLGERNIIL